MMKMNEPSFEQPGKDDFELSGNTESGSSPAPSLEEMTNDPKFKAYLQEWPEGPDVYLTQEEMRDADIYELEGKMFFMTPDGRVFNENLEMVHSGRRLQVLDKGKLVKSRHEAA